MTAYMTVFFDKIHALDWLTEYAANVPAILRSHGGEYVAISKAPPNAIESVEGSAPAPIAIVLFRFPSVAAAKGFVNSREYAPFRKARQGGSESDFFVFENDDDAPQWRR